MVEYCLPDHFSDYFLLCPISSSGVLLVSGERVERFHHMRSRSMGFREKWVLWFVLLALVSVVPSCSLLSPERPSLVVFVVVDQLRADLLDEYDSLFTGGFRKLRDQGLRFTRATHDHAKTTTCAGHAVLGTGAFPSSNGIVDNEWLERTPEGWRSVYCVEDTLSHILGFPAMEGRSPQHFLRDGLADWILAADSGAVILSASRKDRAAIGLAARARGQVFWITENQGQFVTSSYYSDAYPGWVERFNLEEMPRIFGDSVWEQTLSPEARACSRRDTVAYEGDGEHTFFPHRFTEEVEGLTRPGALNRWAYGQIHPDEAVAAFAQVAVQELDLGGDDVTDYLALSFSQTDAIGHDYGPFSREQLENLVHLDRLLGDLMDLLDEKVGSGRWLMALSADHGALAIPEYLAEQGKPGSRLTSRDLSELRGILDSHQGREGDPLEVANALVAELEALPFVADAFPVAEMNSSPPADSFSVLFRNSYYPDRWHWGYGSQGSGVLFRFVEACYWDPTPRGTGHGSPYYYDRHVPLIFYGFGVDRGVSDTPVSAVDIAPTLAHLAGIAIPPEVDGVPVIQ
jgi:predicted AlkP superfamily pyrophosphatase or phosphodiesterase